MNKHLHVFVLGFYLFSSSPSIYSEKVSFNYVLWAYKDHNYKLAIELSKDTKTLNEQEDIALTYILAHSFYQLKEYDQAINFFQKILTSVPYRYEVLNNIGACYYYLKNYKKALSYFKESLTDKPNYPLAQKNYSLLENALSKSSINSSSNNKVENLELYSLSNQSMNDVNLAWLYFYLGNNVDAIHLLKQATKADPQYSFAYMSLGYIYDSTFNHKTALKYYEKALELDDEYPDLWNNIGVTYFFLGDNKKAVKHFEKAIELNSKFPYPLNNLAFLYLSEHNIDKAINYFLKVIEIENSDPMILSETYAGLAICNFLENKFNVSAEFKKKSIQLNSNLSDKSYLSKYLHWSDELIKIFLVSIK